MSLEVQGSTREKMEEGAQTLGSLAAAVVDLQALAGSGETQGGAQATVNRLKHGILTALPKYRGHLFTTLMDCYGSKNDPGNHVLWRLKIYASACAQATSQEIHCKAKAWVDSEYEATCNIGNYALFAGYLQHDRTDVLLALKAGVLAFEMFLAEALSS